MAITTLDGLVAALASAQQFGIYKPSATAKAASDWESLWLTAGNPVAGVAPGSANGVVPTDTTTGSIPFSAAGGSDTTYISNVQMLGATAGMLIISDRLWANSTLSGTVATAQTWTFPGLTRSTSGVGVRMWLEIYTATGSTAATATALYTNQAGTPGQSATAALIASPVAGQMIPFILQSGDTGVQAVSQVTLSVSTGTAGNFGITLTNELALIPLIANVPVAFNAWDVGLPVVDPAACLSFKMHCTTTSTGIIGGSIELVQG